jgi:hypothetical protein
VGEPSRTLRVFVVDALSRCPSQIAAQRILAPTGVGREISALAATARRP